MLTGKFDLKKSVKYDLKSEEKYVVIRDNAILLRILGEEGHYVTVTPTAPDDKGGYIVYQNQSLLMEVFVEVIEKYDLKHEIKKDWNGREYVSCEKAEYLSDVCRFADVFIDHLIEKGYSKSSDRDQM